MYNRFFKKIIDVIVAFIGLIILLIPSLIISLAILIDDPGPIFFAQKRVGVNKNGQVTYFKLLKFRSMKVSTPSNVPTHLLENPEQYITKVGAFLRKTSLDELPQILNILSGSMSIIGPRPALWNQYDLIEEREKSGVNNLKPGLTGWAQINGRDELEIDKKVALDAEYAENIGFAFDIKCFFMTIKSVLKSDGVVEGGTGAIAEKEHIDEKKEDFVG